MIALYSSLVILGILGIDPIGIAAMPVLLLQNHPIKRSMAFLSGSFFSLVVIGIIVARYTGLLLINLNIKHVWAVQLLEIIAGILLIAVAGIFFWRMKHGDNEAEPSKVMLKRLKLATYQLFILGAFIVAVQSIVDIIFVIAMVKVGQLNLSVINLLVAVIIYAVAALLLQLSIVVAFVITPVTKRDITLNLIHRLLNNYSSGVLIVVSLVLGCALLINAYLA